jgi:hypothetical protein
LDGLVKRVSGGRVCRLDRLTPKQGSDLIELLKAIHARGEAAVLGESGVTNSAREAGTQYGATAEAGARTSNQTAAATAASAGQAAEAPEAAPPQTDKPAVPDSNPWGEEWYPRERWRRR